MGINKDRVQELLQILQASSAAELSVREGDQRIRLARPVLVTLPPASEPVVAETGGVVEQPAPVSSSGLSPASTGSEQVTVKARVVGLFHRGKEPGGSPLVEVGQAVREGQVLGIIDVLRKPTEVLSPAAGQVIEIHFEDGHGVQYGDDLFVIKLECQV